MKRVDMEKKRSLMTEFWNILTLRRKENLEKEIMKPRINIRLSWKSRTESVPRRRK